MDLFNIKKVHCLGIGGIGVSAVAKFFLAQGKTVVGSDMARSEITEDLEKRGVKIFYGQGTGQIDSDTDLIIYSPAVSLDGIVSSLTPFTPRNIVMSYPEFLGELSKNYYTIAVSGTHGKSTTTALIGLMLEAAGFDPLVIVGSRVPGWEMGNIRLPLGTNAELNERRFFVVEACEHQANMLKIYPRIAVITNIESDHLDYYQNLENIIEAFGKFGRSVPPEGKVFINGDDENSKRLAIDRKKIKTFGFDTSLRLNIPGRFNVYNASAARAVAMELGASAEVCQKILADFQGIWRRFEVVRENPLIISDYGHHPTAIRETAQAAREFYPGRRIVLVYQPHQHQRTKSLFDDFVKELAAPDLLILSDIYDVAGREKIGDKDVSSRQLIKAIRESNPDNQSKYIYGGSLFETEKKIRELFKDGDVIIVMGAGDIDAVARHLSK